MAGAGQHGRRSIHANDVDASLHQRFGDAAGATAQFQHTAISFSRQIDPERDVASAERARVLPIVERRVLIPAEPALG